MPSDIFYAHLVETRPHVIDVEAEFASREPFALGVLCGFACLCLLEHRRSVAAGYSITGPYMGFVPHINGTLIMQVPWWIDHPSVHQTPPEEGWDIYHREAILADAYRTKLILNLHGSRKWKRDQLVPIAGEFAWMTSQKDDSVITWAERALVAKRGKRAVWKPLPRLVVAT